MRPTNCVTVVHPWSGVSASRKSRPAVASSGEAPSASTYAARPAAGNGSSTSTDRMRSGAESTRSTRHDLARSRQHVEHLVGRVLAPFPGRLREREHALREGLAARVAVEEAGDA